MTVLIFLIVIDLIMIGVVMYFVMNEKATHREHYIPDQTDAAENPAPPAPAQTHTRDWAVQTTSDSDIAATPTTAEEVVEEIEEAAQHEQGLDPIHEERLPDDAQPISLSEAAEDAAEHPNEPLNEENPEDGDGKDRA